MAVDRCDVQYEVKVLARQMKAPTERSWMHLEVGAVFGGHVGREDHFAPAEVG